MQPEVKWMMNYLDERPILPEMKLAMDTLWDWSCRDHGYASKNDRIREWNQNNQGINEGFDYYDILCHILAGTFLHPQGMTYQAMIGFIAGKIGCADPLNRAKCAAEVVAIAHHCELVVITKVNDETFLVTTEYELDEEIPEFLAHVPEFTKPDPVLFNPILGNSFKQHAGDICVDHINRMNAIPLTLEFRVITAMPEEPKDAFVTRADTEVWDSLSIEEQREEEAKVEAWEDFKQRSLRTYSLIAQQNNRFHLMHWMDTRGRSYCEGYYANYQGSSFKKAIVQLHEREIVKL